MVVKQRNIRSRSQSTSDYQSNGPSRNPEGFQEQYNYPPMQPQKQPSMTGFYFLIISLFMIFTLAMGGMMWFVVSQLKSDSHVQVTTNDDEDEDEEEQEETRERHKKSSVASSSKKKSKVAVEDMKTSERKSETNIFKKLNNECGACVVLIEGQDEEGSWTGTGFIIYQDQDPKGQSLILTNLHVAKPDADGFVVQSKSGEVTEAELAGVAKDGTDLAILAIPNMSNLKPIWKLRSSQMIEEGDDVYTVGHPLGHFDFTVSGPGKLSKKRYNDAKEANGAILQHTAPISPGNSGGPLLDAEGNIFGINTSLAGEGNALFFAIPIEFLHKEGAWIWRAGYASKIQEIKIQGE